MCTAPTDTEIIDSFCNPSASLRIVCAKHLEWESIVQMSVKLFILVYQKLRETMSAWDERTPLPISLSSAILYS